MRILHVVPTYKPAYRYGGPIESVHALNKHLARKGVQVDVFTTAINGPENLDVPMDKPVLLDGVNVRYFPPSALRSWFYSRNMFLALKENTKEYDLVHITSVFLSESTLAARAATKAGKPYVISPRGSLMKATYGKKHLKKKIYVDLIEKKNLAHASAIHFTTQVEKEEYEALHLPMRKGIVIPNGLDTDSLPPGDPVAFRSKFGIHPEDKVVLFLSRISWKKGLDTLLEAFAGLQKEMPEALLVIVGGDDEGYKAKVEKDIEEKGLKDRVIFTGPLEGEMKSAAYQAADVFALPSYAENFGIVVAEAMHFGLPVVVTNEVGVSKWVKDEEAGFVVRKDDLEVKFALFKILKDKVLAESMGQRGRRLVSEEFSYAAIADRFIEEYKSLISRRS